MAFATGLGMIKLTLNGKKSETKHNNIKGLISEMELPKFFVVEKNGTVIYKENYETESLNNDDIIEVAAFCGGG